MVHTIFVDEAVTNREAIPNDCVIALVVRVNDRRTIGSRAFGCTRIVIQTVGVSNQLHRFVSGEVVVGRFGRTKT